MRIMIDTNILISAILFRSQSLSRLIEKVAEEYTLVLSTYVIYDPKYCDLGDYTFYGFYEIAPK